MTGKNTGDTHPALDANFAVGFGFQPPVRVATWADDHAHEVVARVLLNRNVNLLLDLTERHNTRGQFE